MRGLAVQRPTAQITQIRGLLLEYGIEVAQGRAAIQRRLPAILEDADNGLSERFRAELHALAEELRLLNERVAHYDDQIEQIAQGDAQARALGTIPGLGAKVAAALLAGVDEDPQLLKNGGGLAAWLGLVPRQHSTGGGRARLLGISKRGDAYPRTLLIRGARAVRRCIERKDDPTSRWATALKARRHPNVAVVAMAYAVIVSGKPYDPAQAALANG
jgi:transposase